MARSYEVELPCTIPDGLELNLPVGLAGPTAWLQMNSWQGRAELEADRSARDIFEHGGYAIPKSERTSFYDSGNAVTWAVEDDVSWAWLLKGISRKGSDAAPSCGPNASGSMVVVGIRPEKCGLSTDMFAFDRSCELFSDRAVIRYNLEAIMSKWNGNGYPDLKTAACFATFCDQLRMDVRTLVISLHRNGTAVPVQVEVGGQAEYLGFVQRMRVVTEEAFRDLFNWESMEYDGIEPFDESLYLPKTEEQLRELRAEAIAKLTPQDIAVLGLVDAAA
jgi:hypothetical protein